MPHEALIASLTATAARAREVGAEERAFEIGGSTVNLRFAGPAVRGPLTRALAHLAVDDSPVRDLACGLGPAPPANARERLLGDVRLPALTIDVWDSQSTRTRMPAPPWGKGDYLEHGRIRGFFQDGLYAVYSMGAMSLSVIDAPGERAWHWMRAPSDMPFVISAGPFHPILHIWAAARELQYVHAAAVGSTDGCALLIGQGGRGKSSTALACAGQGLGYLGDDYLLVGEDPPTAMSLFSSAKLTEAGIARMPWLKPLVANPVRAATEKAIVFLAEHHPELLVSKAPIRALVIPRVTGAKSTVVTQASRADAFAALGPSTALQLAGADAAMMERLLRLVSAVPAFHLELAEDPTAIAAAIGALLD